MIFTDDPYRDFERHEAEIERREREREKYDEYGDPCSMYYVFREEDE